MPALAIDALAHGALESRFRPAADASVRIGRDVGGHHRAERRRQAEPAGERLAARRGVAGVAVANRGEFGTAAHHSLIEHRLPARVARRDLRLVSQCKSAGGNHADDQRRSHYNRLHHGARTPRMMLIS